MPREDYNVQACTIEDTEIYKFYKNPQFNFKHFLFEFTLIGNNINLEVSAINTNGDSFPVTVYNYPPRIYEVVKFNPEKLIIQPLIITSHKMLDNVIEDLQTRRSYKIKAMVFSAKRYTHDDKHYVSYKVRIKRI